MKDNGLIVATKGSLADVEVDCKTACQSCAAKSLCLGQSQSKGVLPAKNPLQAHPGDRVAIDIPENMYSRSLILFFGSLLFAGLAGMALGYLGSALTFFSAETGGILGLLIGIFSAGLWLSRRFRKKMNEQLVPTITMIIDKGGNNGKT